MASCEDIQLRLTEHVDDELANDERAGIEQHLMSCAACRGVADDLTRLRDTARALGPIEPPSYLWLAVAGRIRTNANPDRTDLVPPSPAAGNHEVWKGMAIAASLVLTILAAYLATRPTWPARPPALSTSTTSAPEAGNATAGGSVESVADDVRQGEARYDSAIQQLETLTKTTAANLTPDVAATLQRNLTVIDQAIAESRTALQQQPDSEPARESLFEALRRKVGVLENTVTLTSENPMPQEREPKL